MLSRNGICYRICNSTTVELTTDKYVEPIIENHKIAVLLIGEEKISLKQSFVFPMSNRTVTYEINHIIKINDNMYLLKTELTNKTSQYILPILEKLPLNQTSKKLFSKDTLEDISRYCKDSYFVNAYLGSYANNELDGYLYLKFRFSPHDIYQAMEDIILHNHPLFCKVIDQKEEYTYYKFKIPIEFREDIKTFLGGKYTELSNVLKFRILKFYLANKESNIYQILYGKDDYREKLSRELGHPIDGELDSIPELINEIIII